MNIENLEPNEAQTSVDQTQPVDPSAEAANVLFGTISYADENAYENFLQKMNLSQAVFILVASANFAQAKGAFNLLESETLSTAIRTVRKNSTPPPSENESLETNNEN